MAHAKFIWVEDRGYIPDITPPKNWQSAVSEFYKNKKEKKIEEDAQKFAKTIESTIFGKIDIKLGWDKKLGLDRISLGTHPGIYLNENFNWQEHNLGTKTSLIATGIILNYYAELSRYIK